MVCKGRVFHHSVIIAILCCVCLMTSGCRKQPQKQEVQILQKTIRSFIGKTPNDLYAKLGMPAKYEAIVDDKTNIMGAKITYNYVYNFNEGVYDCQVLYFTNKEQNRIISVAYSSDKCHYIFR